MIARRTILTFFSLGICALALPSRAQQPPKIARIGFLSPASRQSAAVNIGWFVSGLRELGYVEGRNILIEWRFADGKYERLPGLTAELMRLKVDLILTVGGPGARAAQQATTTIPIVMANMGDAVGLGFAASLSRPGGNITGTSGGRGENSGKSLEFLLAIVPKLSRVAVLLNPASPISPIVLKQIQAAARTAGVSVAAFEAGTTGQIDAAFGPMARARTGALVIVPDPFLSEHAPQVAALAARQRLPAIYPFRRHVEAGGLMSYGPNEAEMYRQAARQVDKILKGAKPADIPVEQPTKLELVINRRTAKVLGLTIPQELLLRADEVIE